METRRNYPWFAMIGVQILAVVALVLAGDQLVRLTLDHVQTWRLQTLAASGASEATNRVATLQQQVGDLQDELSRKAARHTPSPDDLRSAASSHHISIRRLERVSRSKATGSKETYMIALSGRPLDLIAYLHELWEKHSLAYDQAGLQRSDEYGEMANLTLTCAVTTP